MNKVLRFKLFVLSLCFALAINAQDATLSGVVRDVSNNPLIGVNVVQKGTTKGTITNHDGEFSFQATPHSTIVFTYIGFAKQEIAWDGNSRLNVTLLEDSELLEEVVVVGYGTAQKVNLTGAVEQVTSKVFENRPITNITQGLVGVIPNLNISLTDGKPTQSPSYNVRGTTSIGQGGNALVLIDGVEGDPRMLNPNDIESVSVLKDEPLLPFMVLELHLELC